MVETVYSDGLFLVDEQATVQLGAIIARLLPDGFVLYLSGELGAGKTALVRSVLHCLGVEGAIKSPTYSLVESYFFQDRVCHHFDCYRLTEPASWFEAGLDEYCYPPSILLIEWPEQAQGCLPFADAHIRLDVVGAQGRICFGHSINTDRGLAWWEAVFEAALRVGLKVQKTNFLKN